MLTSTLPSTSRSTSTWGTRREGAGGRRGSMIDGLPSLPRVTRSFPGGRAPEAGVCMVAACSQLPRAL